MGELPHRQRPSVIHLHAQPPSVQVLLTGVSCNTLESWQGLPNQDQDMQKSKCVELLRHCTLPGPTRDLPRADVAAAPNRDVQGAKVSNFNSSMEIS